MAYTICSMLQKAWRVEARGNSAAMTRFDQLNRESNQGMSFGEGKCPGSIVLEESVDEWSNARGGGKYQEQSNE
jgi:hypothetical protein